MAKAKSVSANEKGATPPPASASSPGIERQPASPAPSSSSAEDRRRALAEAAYYRAARRGFEPGREEEDWLEAEKELDRLLPK